MSKIVDIAIKKTGLQNDVQHVDNGRPLWYYSINEARRALLFKIFYEVKSMKKTFAIATDSGKFQTKSIFEINGSMRTKMTRTLMREGHSTANDDLNIEESNVHQIIFDGVEYTIGDETTELVASNVSLDKNSELHLLTTLTNICYALKQAKIYNDVEISLAINIPASQYADMEEKMSIEKMYNKRFAMTFEGEEFEFEIKNVLVLFESAGIVVKYMNQLKDNNTLIIDCGGLNVTYLNVEAGKMKLDTLHTNTCGANKLIDDLKAKILSTTGREVPFADIEKVVKNEKLIQGAKADKINELIKSAVAKNVATIIKDANRSCDLDSYNLLFVGGSSSIYSNLVAEKLQKNVKLAADSVFDNVSGYYTLMKAKKLA